nr:hypothetical protein [Candidatus Saccharibacteria bacterium]NIW78571.1 hypothetical protein [Calditrichia bacterium]
MKKIQPLKRILLTLLVIILLPALFYSAFEINSLSNREKMIEEIYQQQLETILFSVNQYSWDVANNWASKINILYEETTPSAFQNIFADFLSRNQTIQAIFLVDSGLTDLTVFSSRQSNDH